MSQDPTLFPGQVDADGRIHLDEPLRQVEHCKQLAGQRVDVIIAAQGQLKSRLQECGFHAMITPWARGEGHQIDDLKRDLLEQVFGLREHTNPITGEIVMVLREPHTSTLSRAKYSELIKRTLEIAASCGVVLQAPDEYRRQQEQRRKGRAA